MARNRRSRSQRGQSLPEVMVAVVIAGSVVLAGASGLVLAVRTSGDLQRNEKAVVALENVADALEGTRGISWPDPSDPSKRIGILTACSPGIMDSGYSYSPTSPYVDTNAYTDGISAAYPGLKQYLVSTEGQRLVSKAPAGALFKITDVDYWYGSGGSIDHSPASVPANSWHGKASFTGCNNAVNEGDRQLQRWELTMRWECTAGWNTCGRELVTTILRRKSL